MGSESSKLARIDSIYNLIIQEPYYHLIDNESIKVQCVIRWSFGGDEIFISGSFNSWKKQEEYKLYKSGYDHIIAIELTRDIHFYKFIVDGEWRCSPDYPIKFNCKGYANNYLDLKRYKAPHYSAICDKLQHETQNFHQKLPTEFPADAPALPILLGKSRCPLEMGNGIHIPYHCISNHIYYDSLIQEIFGPQVATFCVTKRWPEERYIHKNQCIQRFTTILYSTFRTTDEFWPISICKRNGRSVSRGSKSPPLLENDEYHYDPYISDRLLTTVEAFATIFR
ncbi:AMP-activated protein kinase beta chain-containing protein [Cryptosporidium canis]|uniref:AMP-activated protein kinase beta chain-containing protein n=1 Tax=Cryptosporidium canis TaxID=195482 RepID=A0ABQ8P7V7_9CRYT|nr:AMP-activated protein kinase beta chain-containing protein [Cryptosporidium canis]